MTWPFENDTSAIVKKLAGRSMQADKRNKAFLLLTIAISVCMVFSILLISTGTQEKFKNTQRNKAQIGILGVTDEQTAQLRQNGNITWVGEYSALGVFYVENKTITVATVYKGNIIKNLIMDCQSYTKYRPNETTGGIFVSWRRKEELPTGA